MRTERFGIVTPLKDNEESGFGPGYSSDPKGPLFVGYLADSMQPAVYAIRCEGFDEAYDHFQVVLCRELEDDDSDRGEIIAAAEAGNCLGEWGMSHCADGTIRHTETLYIVHVATPDGHYYRD